MTNGEKYEKEIVEIVKSKEKSICDDFINKIVLPSYGMKCDNRCIECRTLVDIWLSKEYKEPEVDWSKVKVDTPVWVKSIAGNIWFKRHFAKFEDETVYAWDDGRTSFTTEECSGWEIVELADDEDKEEQE